MIILILVLYVYILKKLSILKIQNSTQKSVLCKHKLKEIYHCISQKSTYIASKKFPANDKHNRKNALKIFTKTLKVYYQRPIQFRYHLDYVIVNHNIHRPHCLPLD